MADELAHKLAFINLAHMLKETEGRSKMPSTREFLEKMNLKEHLDSVKRDDRAILEDESISEFKKLYNYMQSYDFEQAYGFHVLDRKKRSFTNQKENEKLAKEVKEFVDADKASFDKAVNYLARIPVDKTKVKGLITVLEEDISNFAFAAPDSDLRLHGRAMEKHVNRAKELLESGGHFKHELFHGPGFGPGSGAMPATAGRKPRPDGDAGIKRPAGHDMKR